MALFIDSTDLNEIKKYMKMGIIWGVNTNPAILLKNGFMGSLLEKKGHFLEIAKTIYPYPYCVEVTTNEKDQMLDQAQQLAKLSDNIVVSIPIHGPEGELHNIEIIHALEHQYNIRVNVTAMMSAQQCFLAAMAGATYVSLFCGRVNNMGYNCIEELRKTRNLIDKFNLKSKIIACAIREILNVIEWWEAGAHIVAVSPNLIGAMFIHPYTKETVKDFLEKSSQMTQLSNDIESIDLKRNSYQHVKVDINLPTIDPTENYFIIEQIREAIGNFMEVFDFELDPENKPVEILGSWFGTLIFKTKKLLSSQEVKQVIKEMEEALHRKTIDLVGAEEFEKRAKAARDILSQLENVDEAAIRMGDILIAKATINGKVKLVIETITPDLARAMAKDPGILRNPSTICNLFSSEKGHNEGTSNPLLP